MTWSLWSSLENKHETNKRINTDGNNMAYKALGNI